VNDFSAAEKLLHRAPFLVDQAKPDATSPLHVAAVDGHVDMAKILIKASVNVTVLYLSRVVLVASVCLYVCQCKH